MTLPTSFFVSSANSAILNRLCEACATLRAGKPLPVSYWSPGDTLAWCGFLLRMGDPLASEPLMAETSFRIRAERMVAALPMRKAVRS